jgi:glycosyltransferase involved in cell wall biosynthesis
MTAGTKNIVCFGAGPVFKGGMSNYNTSLAKSLAEFEHTKVHIVSWSQQYPGIIPREFKDKVSTLNFLEGYDIPVKYITNYNNPLSWDATARHIAALQPDQVIFQWSIAIQGLPIGYIIKKLKQICACEIILDLHFVVQKERSSIDRWFTKQGISLADTYIVHAYNTFKELQELFPDRKFIVTETGQRPMDKAIPVLKLFHPIYDLFQPDPAFDVAAFKKTHGLKRHVFLFFGFIRKYKGLHHAIEAFDIVAKQRNDVSFLICGELFWNTLDSKNLTTKIKKGLFALAKKIVLKNTDNEENYNPLHLIEERHLEDSTMVVSQFIPNEDVHKYFQVADAGILFYSRATPSGIESLSYNFDLPILTSNAGHFPETIREGENGYMISDYTVEDMANTMLKFLDQPIPRENVAHFKNNLSWQRYAAAVLGRF